ncbi:HipA family kinase [Dokdonella sp.]|uniref:HipA family kinase n=1 Tax=Dokdonella sp. TaxID=2291710 RepID=UPI003C4BFB98
MRTVTSTRYVTPLREGGSLPAIIEADDAGMYVLKFRGAGQGPKALVAELVAGELARACGLPMPEIVLVEVDAELARTEPDPEIQDLIRASEGLNLALDYLPGAVTFDPLAWKPDAELASRIVWLDALVTNIDRTPRNTNMMVWHDQLWLIDHGAALYFHHAWDDALARSRSGFPQIRDHVLLPFANRLDEIDAGMAAHLGESAIRDIVTSIPDAWLERESGFANVEAVRDAYVDWLLSRLQSPREFCEEAIRAHAALV